MALLLFDIPSIPFFMLIGRERERERESNEVSLVKQSKHTICKISFGQDGGDRVSIVYAKDCQTK